MSSTSSIVISFSIAILLLLVLLLLLSYNSKCNVDKVERFVNDSPMFNNGMGYSNEGFANDMLSQPPNFSPNVPPVRSSVALNDKYVKMEDEIDKKDPIKAFDSSSDSLGNFGGANLEGFENPTGMPDPTSCFKRDRLTKDDLLPKDANLKWATVNPSSAGDITDKNFLTAGYHMGINTVGQSLRNANLQLRSEIPNPQVAVSPWMISTIEPDVRPVTFEIGSSPSY